MVEDTYITAMITLYPYRSLGNVNHGWLDARHHFSFGHYYHEKRLGFGTLLVINDDIIAAGRGFGMHPHDNMEIITYVREGAITHTDSMGNVGKTGAGDVQVMSAGTGVRHSEHNHEPIATRLYQIWIEPNKQNVPPRWEAKQFPKIPSASGLSLLVSGMQEHENKGALFIHQDAAIYGGVVPAYANFTHPVKHNAYVLASHGEFTLGGVAMKQGDGAEVTGEKSLAIVTQTEAELLVIDVP